MSTDRHLPPRPASQRWPSPPNPGTDNTYAAGDTITVSLTFSEAVTVTGKPYVTLDIDGQPRNATYTSAGTATGRPRQDPGACWARRTRHALSINWDLPLERSAGSA